VSKITPAPFGLREAGASRGEAEWAGVLLHGRERTKKEMLDLAAQLDFPGARWLAPYADAGKWYPGRFMEPMESNEPYLTHAVERCDRVVDEASDDGRLGAERIIVAGFSQGACIAVEYALRRASRCAAVMIFTGGLMGSPRSKWTSRPGSLRNLRVFITGSDIDEWIPEESTRETARVLETLGAKVDLHIYPGRPHIVGDQEVADARTFLTSLRAGNLEGRS
jgi:phospholipase/carboxylesterase